MTKKPINSRDKGKRGEQDWSKFLYGHGFPARRGQQFSGGPGSPDVICDALPDLHFEVKFAERLSLYKAMEQAGNDAGRKTPVVAHRHKGEEWLVVMRAEDWIKLIKQVELMNIGNLDDRLKRLIG